MFGAEKGAADRLDGKKLHIGIDANKEFTATFSD